MIGQSNPRYRPPTTQPATAEYVNGVCVIHSGYSLRERLKAAGFAWCSPDRTWRKAMTEGDYDTFTVSLGMRDRSRDWR